MVGVVACHIAASHRAYDAHYCLRRTIRSLRGVSLLHQVEPKTGFAAARLRPDSPTSRCLPWGCRESCSTELSCQGIL